MSINLEKVLKVKFVYTIVFLAFAQVCLGQGGNSPFSILGIGDIVSQGNVRNDGMGGVGISNPHPLYGNALNPANLVYNQYTYFDAGVYSEYKTITEGSKEQTDFGGNISYVSFGFPVNKNWVTSAGLKPYSIVNFETSSTEQIPSTSTYVQYDYDYSGGVNQVYWSNGVRLYKGLTAGLEIAYNFGSITTSSYSTLISSSTTSNVEFLKRIAVSDFTFKPAINYSGKISEKMILNVGGTYTIGSNLNVKQHEEIVRNYYTSSDQQLRDTLTNNQRGHITMPSEIAFGISIEKQYTYVIGIDISKQSWTDFRDFDGDGDLNDTYTYRLGAEWVPDITSVSNYFKRVAYRAGVSYQQLPFEVDGDQVEKLSASVGFSLPVNRGFSNLNFAFIYGTAKAGGSSNDVSEEFIQFKVGLTVNDRWFVRRRIN
ncbi:hypothetical protein [Chondrinema litorale]|uniref:hypothetical protein n=1 Tax=Chondrinema litorale TaxID=2994555 RepID=UPI00254356CD|nr:hypothetical protein [Chondrinema litorale]UZR92633.1 hypothetical protein OQ292_12275 [Chondrinema litorale]